MKNLERKVEMLTKFEYDSLEIIRDSLATIARCKERENELKEEGNLKLDRIIELLEKDKKE